MSFAPDSGELHLLYHLCAQAVLPYDLSGKEACVVVLDMDGTFSVPRLVNQTQDQLRQRGTEIAEVEDLALRTLQHVHVFRPQSLDSASATLDALADYLFDQGRHYSFDRLVAFVALSSCSVFYWQDRLDMENAAFHAATSSAPNKPKAPPSNYVQLSTSLKAAIGLLRCPAIITTWHLGPMPQPPNQRSLRPSIPTLQPTLRLVIHRLPVRKFPANISIEEALRQTDDRQKAIEEGSIECFVNEWNLDERTLQVLQKVDLAFGIRITDNGVTVDEAES